MRTTPCRWCLLTAALLLAGPARAQPPKLNIVHPLPPAPAWLDGYQVRWPVRVLAEPSKQTGKTVVVALPTGGWLKPDAADLAVQAVTGELLPTAVLSHDPAGDTILQFKRRGNDPWYWVYGVGKGAPRADPKADAAFREGLTLEVRDWAGGDLDSWAKVHAGLQKSEKIAGNAVVTQVMQNCNPARPDVPTNFAASYRGYLDVKKDGTYRFLVNSDAAAFVFIDGFKVFERPGAGNRPLGPKMKAADLEKLVGKVDLKAGVHAFEVHHVVADGPDVVGTCALLWGTPEQPKYAYLPPAAIAHPLYARVAAVERAGDKPIAAFVHGLDDSLDAGGLKLFLVRFEATGALPDDASPAWDFGDGGTGKGRSVVHAYFKEGDYAVTLKSGADLPFRRKIHVWPEPGDTSPLSLELAIKALAARDWKAFDAARLRQVFSFLQRCPLPEAWPLLDAVAGHLLAQKDLDLETRSQLYVARLEALTRLDRAADALKLAEAARPEFAKTPALLVRLQLGAAAVYQYHYKDPAAASKLYKSILDEHGRTEHPNLRLAAIRWGDLFAEAGDLARAAETYRVAATLGGEAFAGASVTDASTRGALLRIAEQKLKGGEILATRQLLERLELEHPGRRLDGLYCFLRAEADRFAGRYEEALRHYEMIFKLPQWAGYRDRATFGIADTYGRLGDLDKAQKWLDDLKESSPKFFEEQKGAEAQKLLAERQARRKAGGDEMREFVTGFEPDEPAWFGEFPESAVVHAPALGGRHAALLDVYPREMGNMPYSRPLTGLTPGGTYWVEVWYRDILRPATPPPGHNTHVNLTFNVAAPPASSALAQQVIPLNAHHDWHKVSFKVKNVAAHDAVLNVSFMNLTGAFLVDRLTVRPVSDRQLDALVTLQEGAKGP